MGNDDGFGAGVATSRSQDVHGIASARHPVERAVGKLWDKLTAVWCDAGKD